MDPLKTQSYLRNISVVAEASSQVVSIPAGAAGTLKDFSISEHGITNAGGTDLGGAGDTSLAITVGDAFDTEVGKKDDADLANGEFYLDYLTGKGRGRKATTGTSLTFTYKVFKLMIAGITINTGDLEIGAVEIKNPTDDTRAVVGANGLYVDVRTIQGGTSLIGKIAAGLMTGVIYDGATALTPKFSAPANVAQSQTDSQIVAAVTAKKIRVLGAFATCGATATNLTFNSKGGGAGVAISPVLQNGINGGEVLPFSPVGWFETVAGEALTVTTGAGSTTGLLVVYAEV